MDDLVAFLRARLDEDEAAAKASPGASSPGVWGLAPLWSLDYDGLTIHRERVLREVEAKRRIVDEQESCADYGPIEWLASVYSDHSDYRPEWKPQ